MIFTLVGQVWNLALEWTDINQVCGFCQISVVPCGTGLESVWHLRPKAEAVGLLSKVPSGQMLMDGAHEKAGITVKGGCERR